jgi:hypothetical protein
VKHGDCATHKTMHRLLTEPDFDALDQHVSQDITHDDIPPGLTSRSRDELTDRRRARTSAWSDPLQVFVTYLEGRSFSLARFGGRGRHGGARGRCLPPVGR